MRTLAMLLIAAALTLGAVGCEDTLKDPEPTPTPTIGPPTAVPTNIPIPEVTAEATTTASGLQIIDIEIGEGAAAVATDSVTVHYTGWLEDGTTFDSSVPRGQPAPFSLDPNSPNTVIAGWQEGLLGMQPGGKRRLIIPSDLAYGEAGRGDLIPPNATLTFDIELISID
jgi:FKBP-type peptidyl-prolyl cis-trans isomerase